MESRRKRNSCDRRQLDPCRCRLRLRNAVDVQVACFISSGVRFAHGISGPNAPRCESSRDIRRSLWLLFVRQLGLHGTAWRRFRRGPAAKFVIGNVGRGVLVPRPGVWRLGNFNADVVCWRFVRERSSARNLATANSSSADFHRRTPYLHRKSVLTRKHPGAWKHSGSGINAFSRVDFCERRARAHSAPRHRNAKPLNDDAQSLNANTIDVLERSTVRIRRRH